MDIMMQIEDNSVDLIIVDPPYNANKGFANDSLEEQDFIDFTMRWFELAASKLKPSGSFYCFINEKRLLMFKSLFDEMMIFRRLIIWEFEGFYNKFKRNYDNRTEYVLFYTKSEDYIFNVIKEEPSESLVKRWGPYADEKGDVPYEKLTPSMRARQPKTVYDKNPINVRRGLYHGNVIRAYRPRYRMHVAQKPEKVVYTCMMASSNDGDLVLDPFCGSGTTCVVAKKTGRNWIGIELDDGFHATAVERVNRAFEGEKIDDYLKKKNEEKGITRLEEYTQ